MVKVDSRFLPPPSPPVCGMNIDRAWNALTEREKKYAHWMAKAGWAGGRIIMASGAAGDARFAKIWDQWTPYATKLYDLLVHLFSLPDSPTTFRPLPDLNPPLKDEHRQAFLSYAAHVFSNLCNYRSFGNTKFVPDLERATFERILREVGREKAMSIWKEIGDQVYAITPESILLVGKPAGGHVSNYYPSSGNVDQTTVSDEDVAMVQNAAEELGVDTLNSRLIKHSPTAFTLLIASAVKGDTVTHDIKPSGSHPSFTLKVQKGDFSEQLTQVNRFLAEAQKYAREQEGRYQEEMIQEYIRSFETGSIEAHKEGSRKWVKDVGPVIESYIGFIETYTDPYGIRAEWEGFVAIVDKELSKKYEILVDNAPSTIKKLPWGPDFENDVFRRPDFTALEVLSFATNGCPVGINIPNYFDVRADYGFKNVSLANIMAAQDPNQKFTFVDPEILDVFKAWHLKAFEVQVANHELLGHGSGKLFTEDEHGKLNFDPETINPLTGKKVTSWYKPGQSAGTVLGSTYSSFEECRAETVAMFLASDDNILKIFGYTDEKEKEDLVFTTFAVMARAGVLSLEFYDPAVKKHGQAHMQARVGITLWMISHGLATLEQVRDPQTNELTDAYVRLDRTKVLKEGRDVMAKLLLELGVRKSTADGKGAAEFYKRLTTVPDSWAGELRDLVIKNKQPRKLFVQPTTLLEGDKVVLKDYPLTLEGLIESYIEKGL